jgi:hypothetical protein
MDIVLKHHPVTGRARPQERDFNESRRVVRVVPTNEALRMFLRHGNTRVGFPAEGSAEWPNDAFTKRRIADGDVRIEALPAPEQGEQRRALEQKKIEVEAPEQPKAEQAEQPKT